MKAQYQSDIDEILKEDMITVRITGLPLMGKS